MMNEVNLLISGIDSCRDFQKRLLNMVDQEIRYDSCTIILKNSDNTDRFEDPRVKTFNYDTFNNNVYREYYSMKDMLPLDKEIMQKMAIYEDIAIHELMRNYDTDVLTYDEAKWRYLDHLRFWNHYIKTNRINYILITSPPHQTHNYILYGLAKIFQLKIFIFLKTSFVDRNTVITDFDDPTHYIDKRYLELKAENVPVVLSEDIDHHYHILMDKQKKQVTLNSGLGKKGIIRYAKNLYLEPFTMKYFWNKNKSRIRKCMSRLSDESAKRVLKEAIETDFMIRKRGKIKIRHLADQRYYEKLCTKPDFSEKYVIFFLHHQPEATTLPQGDVFVNQEVLAEMLDYYLAKCGIKLYIKEHYVQPYRGKRFYNQLADLPNTKLISTSFDSADLISNAVAAASISGTIIQESMINGYPVLCFGASAFNNAPGVFHVTSGEEILDAVTKIQNHDYSINQDDVTRYLKAFEEKSIRCRTAVSANIYAEVSVTEEESLANLSRFIIDSINGLWDK